MTHELANRATRLNPNRRRTEPLAENLNLSSADVLGPQGRIAARLPNYELRPQQLAMAEAIERAFADSRHLLVEAGTGVGKSFAYLVPAILATSAGSENGKQPMRRVVISTHTIS
ncbi:MAG: hypothetical protein N2C14_01205, partial [Planctomycetales bacterium]